MKTKYHIYVITYDKGHLKTKKVVDGLLKKKYKVTILAIPFKKRKKNRFTNPKIFNCRPNPILENFDNRAYYKSKNVNYKILHNWSVKDLKKLKFKKKSIFLNTIIKILPSHFVKNKIILNAHPGILPINRGLDSFKWGLIKKYPIGVTLHKIDSQIDRGLIICTKYLKIKKSDDLKAIVKRSFNTECNLLINFEKYLENLNYSLKVSDHFKVSKKRIPLKFEKKLNNIFTKNKKLFMQMYQIEAKEIITKKSLNLMKNLEEYFKQLKIKKNDHLIIHSSFKRIGSYGINPSLFLSNIENFMSDGTLIFPAFTWDKSKKNLKFDYLKSRSEMGILSELFRKKFKYNRTLHPTHSITVSGKDQFNIINFQEKNKKKGPCGKGTIWEYLLNKNTKILLIDTLIESCTFVHYFEEVYNSNDFLEKRISNYTCIDKENKKKLFKLRNHAFGRRSFKKIYFELKKRKFVNQVFFKDVSLISFSSSNLKKATNYLFRKDKKASI